MQNKTYCLVALRIVHAALSNLDQWIQRDTCIHVLHGKRIVMMDMSMSPYNVFRKNLQGKRRRNGCPSSPRYKCNNRHSFGILRRSYTCTPEHSFVRRSRQGMVNCMKIPSSQAHIDNGRLCANTQHHFRTYISTSIVDHMCHRSMDVRTSIPCSRRGKRIHRLRDRMFCFRKQHPDIFLCIPNRRNLLDMVACNQRPSILCCTCIFQSVRRTMNCYSTDKHFDNRLRIGQADTSFHSSHLIEIKRSFKIVFIAPENIKNKVCAKPIIFPFSPKTKKNYFESSVD